MRRRQRASDRVEREQLDTLKRVVENSSSQCTKCSVTNWDDQVRALEAAVRNLRSKSCDIVIANAGVVGQDDMFTLEGKGFAPR